jgi:hypothetical protein
MAQSSRKTTKSQRKGRNVNVSVSITPSSSSIFVSPPYTTSRVASVASIVANNLVVERQQAQEKKVFIMKVRDKKTRAWGNLGGGGNVIWTCNYYNIEYKSTYY